MSHDAEASSIEAWATAYIEADSFAHKLEPPPAPDRFERAFTPRPDLRPGRGPAFVLAKKGLRSTGRTAFQGVKRRAELLHTFLHHELQAAELMAWALVAFPDAPEEARRGLVRIHGDEVRHMRMYVAALRELGVAPGDLPVRDWFWERVPRVTSIDAFFATLGIGFEGANLDHAVRFEKRLRDAGDERAARVQAVVGREEIEHVRFALRWLRETSPRLSLGATLFGGLRGELA
ncbi:MAG: DUF455 family protein [Polyangiaceae bacterium]